MLSDLIAKVTSLVFRPSFEDNRARPRARCHIPISCQSSLGASPCFLKDLSTHGARILTSSKLQKNQDVLLLPPKGSGDGDKEVRCKVAWSRKSQGEYLVGLRFRQANPQGWITKLMRELGISTTVPSQRRSYIRFPTDLKASIRIFGKKSQITLLDLSLGGALLNCPENVSSGAKLTLDIPAHSSLPRISIGSTNVRSASVKDGGFLCSVKFDSLTAEQKGKLTKHLNYLMLQAR